MFQAWQADALARYTIIRYKLPELIKKKIWGGKRRSPAATLQARLWWGVESCCPSVMIQAWLYLSDIPPESCQCWKWNVIASPCLWRMHYIIYGQMFVDVGHSLLSRWSHWQWLRGNFGSVRKCMSSVDFAHFEMLFEVPYYLVSAAILCILNNPLLQKALDQF